MPFIPFPDVPALPGVPALFRKITIFSGSEWVSEKLGILAEEVFGPQWGLYGKDGERVLVFDTFRGIRFKHDSQIAGSPKADDQKKKGYFAVTDKVVNPFEVILTLAHGGDKATRNVMLATLERVVHGTELYSVATPEISYPSVNPVSYTYERGEKNGASLLVVELTVRQAQVDTASESAATKEPSGADSKSNGQVQASSTTSDSGPGRNGERRTIQ